MPSCFTDTDSFVYEIHTDCFYSDMKKDLSRLDTSDYPPENVFGIPRVNKKIPGLFKDELNSQLITEFVGLRSKMYCIRAEQLVNVINCDGTVCLRKVTGIEKIKRAKGVKNYVLKSQISFDDYQNCVINNSDISRDQNSIRAKLHEVYSITQKKIALSPFDNKRVILDDNIDTLPWGHYTLE